MLLCWGCMWTWGPRAFAYMNWAEAYGLGDLVCLHTRIGNACELPRVFSDMHCAIEVELQVGHGICHR